MVKEKRTLSDVAKSTGSNAPIGHGVGRRKRSVARAWLKHGSGKIKVNGTEHMAYFDTAESSSAASLPFSVVPNSNQFDVVVNVAGGGKRAQADAVKLGIARALIAFDETLRPAFRKHSLLTVDARNKERKKPGQPGARKKFQFVKR